ncbi:hypothetical protein DPMN_165059 [Dreissena polymorpha]|uniref:Uncharacterized protein n=1 Tax=Dreissena polymorpha TaxID=45954 RepID=A0A9D4EYX9_DREPO|nr:hypothetical protein DPMN_165059 [Dreissena polymorpha]
MIGQKLKIAPPTGGHNFQQTGTTFELNQDIIKTNILTNFELGRDFFGGRAKLLTKFHEDGTTNVASRVFTSKCSRTDGQRTKRQRPVRKAHLSNQINILTKFHKDWMKTKNILTKFHKDWMKTVTSTVYTNKLLTDGRTHAQRKPDIT